MMEGAPSARQLIMVARPEAELQVRRGGISSAAGADVEALEKLLTSMGATLAPLFGTSEDRLRARAAEARAANPEAEVPDLSVYYRVEATVERLDELAEQMRSLGGVVDAAYFKPPATPASLKPDTTVHQGYLDRIPGGIDVCCAWNVPGGRGQNIKIIDVEGAWRWTHEDLRTENQGGLVSGTENLGFLDLDSQFNWRNHGTNVFGEMGGDRNAFGVTGICPDASLQGSSIFDWDSAGNWVESPPRAIYDAANNLRQGHIILIEIQRPGPRFGFVNLPNNDQRGRIPIEWWPDDFAAILYATTQRGVIVVASAGNGAENLDDPLYDINPGFFPTNWTNPFNPVNPSSGAIVVEAGAPPPGTHHNVHGPDRSRLKSSNHGARVDAQGWGEEVATTGTGDLHPGSSLTATTSEDVFYTNTFNGTSSASPIVVGTLACVQGALLARNDPNLPLLTPATARQLLRDTGSPQQDGPNGPKTQRIGNRPNLCQMMDKAFAASPDHNRGHVAELFFQGTNWQDNDLTSVATSIRPNLTQIPPAAGDPAGYNWEGDGGEHVVYRGHDNHIHELFSLGAGWQHNDLTVDADANPIAAGNPFGYGWAGGQAVVYTDHRGRIQELFNQGGGWQPANDLTLAARNNDPDVPLAIGDPHGYTWGGDNAQHVVYRADGGEIHKLFFQGTWKHNNLTTDAISSGPSGTRIPPAAGDPIGYAWWADDDGQQHVVYRGTDCHIHELFFQLGSQWKHKDLTVQAGNPPPAAGDPHGYTWGGDEGQHIVYRQS